MSRVPKATVMTMVMSDVGKITCRRNVLTENPNRFLVNKSRVIISITSMAHFITTTDMGEKPAYRHSHESINTIDMIMLMTMWYVLTLPVAMTDVHSGAISDSSRVHMISPMHKAAVYGGTSFNHIPNTKSRLKNSGHTIMNSSRYDALEALKANVCICFMSPDE